MSLNKGQQHRTAAGSSADMRFNLNEKLISNSNFSDIFCDPETALARLEQAQQ